MLKLFSCLLITVTFPISMGYTLRTVQEYERGVIFRMGRLKKKSTIGPGMYFIIPCIDKVKVQFNTIFLKKMYCPDSRYPCKPIFTSSLQRFHLNWGCAYLFERRFFGKIWKTYFSGEVIFRRQNPKKLQKIFKKFYFPKPLLGHTNHLYT